MKRTRDNDHFTGMVRYELYIDNDLHTPNNDVTEGTNVKEVAVEDQPCTPQKPFASTNGERPRISSTPDIYY